MSGSMLDDLGPGLGQKIDLNDGRPSSIHGIEVSVHQSEQSKLGLESSGLVRITTLVGQSWQPTRYCGNMIASNKDYLAYVLESRNSYVVRIIQLKTKDRALLKKFTGKICDLSFLHFNSNILAIVDQAGSVHVYDLDIAQGDVSKISETAMIKIHANPAISDNDLHKLVWCPYIHNDDEAAANDSLILAVSNGRRAEVYDIKEIAQEYRVGFVHDKKKLMLGRAYVEDAHEGDICDIALSPDGGVLATAGNDGRVKFWKIDVENIDNEPSCLHDYEPHGGKPVTRILFCDNHLTRDPGYKFWRFLLTASDDNTVIKVWCAVNWKCIQTISFSPPTNGAYPSSKMIMTFDMTASYLVLADTTSMVLYVLPLQQEPSIGDASFTSITEYVLTQSILSFVISGCNPVRFTPIDSSDDEEDEDEGAGLGQIAFNPKRSAVMIHLHCIQTKSLQELRVRFEPPGIMGIPPPLSSSSVNGGTTEAEKQQQPPVSIEDNPMVDHPSTSDTDPLANIPPPLLQDGGPDLPRSLEPTNLMNPSLPYAPGQSSPSVKLLSPDNILSHIGSSPSGGGIPSVSSHVLYSPRDFDSRQNSKDSTTVKSDVESSLNDSLNSQIVTIPLKKINDNDVDNEEMVMTSSPPGGSLTFDNNNEIQSFPSAHSISGSNLEPKIETRNRNESVDDAESWPDLSAEESERKSGSEVTEHEITSQGGVSTSQLGDPPLSQNDFPPGDIPLPQDEVTTSNIPLSPPTLTPPSDDISDTVSGPIDQNELSFLTEARETAANIVTSAINAAIYITEDKLKKNDEEATMSGGDTISEDTATQDDDGDQVTEEERPTEGERDEEDEDEVKSKLSTVVNTAMSTNGDYSMMDVLLPGAVSSSMVNDTLEVDTTVLIDQQPIASSTVRGSIDDNNNTLRLLMEMVQQQQVEIHALKCHTQQSIEGLQSVFRDSFEEFSQGQKSYLSHQLQEHYHHTEKLVKDKPTLEPKKVTQSLTHAVNTTVNSAITSQVERCVKNEFKRTVVPVVQRQLTAIQDQTIQVMQHMLHQKLSIIDMTVKETLERAINVQGVIEGVSGSVASSLHHLVQKNSEAVFLNAVLPSFQNALKEIFAQINGTFQQGMAEYFSQLQVHEATVQENALRTLHTSLLAPNSPLTQLINTTLSQELASVTQQLEASLSGSISSVVRSGIEESLSNTNLAGPSMKQQKDRIKSLLDEKHYDAAFNLALSTSNLEVVTQTCQMINPDEVFDANSDSTLTQPVLLSLIQQLAVGLQDEIDLKMKYLEMAILSLDPEDPITSPHLPPVMQLLHEQIVKVEDQLHASKGGSPGLFRGAKRVRMLASHVKKSTQKT